MKTILVDTIYLDKNAALALVEDDNDDACFHDHGDSVRDVAFSGDGRYLASGSDDKTVKLYDVQTKTLLHSFGDHSYSILRVAFSGDGRYLALASYKSVKLYDMQTKTLLYNFQDHDHYVCGVALSADGRYLASGSYDKTLKLYNVQTKQRLRSFSDHGDALRRVAFSGDGRYLASSSEDKTVKLYDVQTKTLLHSFEDHSEAVYAVAFSGDSRYLAWSSGDTTVKLYDMQTKTLLHSFEDHSEHVYAVAFSGDGRYLASGSGDTTVKLYDMQTKQCFHTLHGHSEWIEGVALSSNGYYLASASGDETVNLLDIRKLILAHEISLGEISSRALVGQAGRQLRLEDKIRADLKPYHQKMLEDTNQGHWSLWDSQQDSEGKIKVHLAPKLVARNPACDIINGVVGIDFGTKSTVVACQKKSVKISPMRIGTGELGSSIEAHHYENPTIIAFNDLQRFIYAYQQRAGRPFTQWRDITISHSANNALLNSSAKFFNAFLFELKQWAGNKNKKLKVVDQQGFVLDLPPFLQLGDDDINPIEIYAYYLGLYINNMHNGIFLNYVLSFPVTYELAIRHKILDSFHQGIKKSLPQALHEQQEYLNKLQVIQGASEPAAYAIVALEAYKFDPCDDEVVFYSVFDFGGGTTDFDFGIFREAQGGKERRYDYALEHFGAGGDKYLGGENLLNLLAFEVFKKNKEKLLERNIQFVLPPECEEFLGSEMLLCHSREAHMNMTNLVETLRPLWENHSEKLADFEQGSLGVNLIDANAKELTNVELDIGKDELLSILQHRIKRGVDNFFERLRLTMSKYGKRLQKDSRINIFLAGNASKSNIVQTLFDERIAEETKKITQASNADANADIYKIFPPLASDDDMEKPTGKTGVAFGLICSRKGGNILVVDENVEQADVDFSFYLGENRKNTFKTIIKRDMPYGQWFEFVDAGLDTFELFYSSAPIVSNNKTPINNPSISKEILAVDVVNEDALVYIRLVNPTNIDYVVALPDEIENETYLGQIMNIDLGV